jgi:hypothetical protein
MPSLDSVTLDTSGFRLHEESDRQRVWSTPAGDSVELYYSPLRPDIHGDVQFVDAIRHVMRSRAAALGAAIIEVDITTVDGCLALRQILKFPQQPYGMTYLGSLILPFRDFSFVVKVRCCERGLTGIRDTVIGNEAWADGRVPGDAAGFQEWMHDPYDPTLNTGFHYNLSEASDYDSRFPTHPLSRLRSVLRYLQPTIQVTSEVRRSPEYVYP